jgi:hypothetical protein
MAGNDISMAAKAMTSWMAVLESIASLVALALTCCLVAKIGTEKENAVTALYAFLEEIHRNFIKVLWIFKDCVKPSSSGSRYLAEFHKIGVI